MRPLKRLALVVLSLLLIFTTLELLCRWGVFYSRAWEVHAEAAAYRSEAPFRVLIVGDSFSADDPTLNPPTFVSQLRKYTEGRSGSVLNLAVPGYGPPEYLETLEWYESYAPDFHPNLVIVNYYVGNDLHDTMARLRGDQTRVELLYGFGSNLLQRSYLIQKLRELRRTLEQRRHLGTIQQKLTEETPAKKEALNPYLADLSNTRPQYLAEALLIHSDDAKRTWKENERIFAKLRKYSKDRNATLVINILPHTLQVNRSHYEFFQSLGFEMDERYLTSTIPQDFMKRFCAQEQILCNDLLPGFKKENTREFYLDRDDHWNGAGFTIAYELVRNALNEHQLLK